MEERAAAPGIQAGYFFFLAAFFAAFFAMKLLTSLPFGLGIMPPRCSNPGQTEADFYLCMCILFHLCLPVNSLGKLFFGLCAGAGV